MKVERACKIVCRRQMGDAVWLTMEAGDMVRTSFRAPGQFVHIKCGDGLLLRRPISVCTCQEDTPEDLLSVVFEARGAGTRWLAARREGDTLDVLGLLGHGFQMEREGRYLLAGGGVGVPPLYGCAQYGAGRATAVLGFRSGEKAILAGLMEEVCERVSIATDDGSLGYHGFVDALVRQELARDRGYTAVLSCGPRPMLKAVAEAARAFGVPCQVSLEERMACGVGACLACACRMKDGHYRHVCADGPVFDAEAVDWDG